jgi:hypothetical protein
MDLGSGSLANLARIRNYQSRRVSSWDRRGGNFDCLTISPGDKVTFAEITGCGIVRHLWMTMASLPPEEHEVVGPAPLAEIDDALAARAEQSSQPEVLRPTELWLRNEL